MPVWIWLAFLLAVLAILAAGAPAAELATATTIAQRLTPPGAVGFARRWRWRARRFLRAGLCISCAATIAGAPLTLAHFGHASAGGLLVNLILVPLSEVPLVLGMASTALSVWPPLLPVARWLNGGAAAALDGMAALAGLAAEVPWPDLTGERVSMSMCASIDIGTARQHQPQVLAQRGRAERGLAGVVNTDEVRVPRAGVLDRDRGVERLD
jgi:predicted membrane metal-binding protein